MKSAQHSRYYFIFRFRTREAFPAHSMDPALNDFCLSLAGSLPLSMFMHASVRVRFCHRNHSFIAS